MNLVGSASIPTLPSRLTPASRKTVKTERNTVEGGGLARYVPEQWVIFSVESPVWIEVFVFVELTI